MGQCQSFRTNIHGYDIILVRPIMLHVTEDLVLFIYSVQPGCSFTGC